MGRMESSKGTVLTLLEPDGGLFEQFTFTRPADSEATFKLAPCGVCHRRHTKKRSIDFCCGRCGVLLHERCWKRIATPAEIGNLHDTDNAHLFLCARCRN